MAAIAAAIFWSLVGGGGAPGNGGGNPNGGGGRLEVGGRIGAEEREHYLQL